MLQQIKGNLILDRFLETFSLFVQKSARCLLWSSTRRRASKFDNISLSIIVDTNGLNYYFDPII